MIGTTLSHYSIEAELGRGGMGIVYKATHTKLNREVAIKVLPAAALSSEEDRARFFREAQSAAQLSHPNVCHVYQVDEAAALNEDGTTFRSDEGPRLFIAMEYIDGKTLQDHVGGKPLSLQEAVSIAGQVAEALKMAHGKQIDGRIRVMETSRHGPPTDPVSTLPVIWKESRKAFSSNALTIPVP